MAKGGNLLLNIGPSARGEWAPEAYERLRGIADWMSVNQEAIYQTEPIAPHKEDKVALTRKRHSDTVYAVYRAEEGETKAPAHIWLSTLQPAEGATLTLLGADGKLNWKKVGNGVLIDIPREFRDNPPCQHAWVVRISEIDMG